MNDVFGWAALVLFMLAELNHAAKQIIKKRKRTTKALRLFMGKQHRVWGILALLIGLLHAVLLLCKINQFDFMMISSGCILLVCILFLTITYFARQNIPRWLPYHKRFAAVSFVLAVLHTILVHI